MIELFLLVASAFWFGWILSKHHSDAQAFKALSESIEYEMSKQKEIVMYIEDNKGMLFAYDTETNVYLSHAETADELKDNLIKKFPNTRFLLVKKDTEILVDNEKR